ncbi:MAG TPA: DUF4260 domain-containing protein [Candidatus Acidoferrum sp.]|nr:DUF4260 domain-containing protein [Candidatus Acidoferrum sp.]
MVNQAPRVLLRAEGLAVAVAAIALYFNADYPWWLLVALILAPDLAMIAYAAGPGIGALAYDVAHTDLWPIVLVAAGVLAGDRIPIELGLIWLVHIGVDRAIGYGLKYPTGFKDTHLQRV